VGCSRLPNPGSAGSMKIGVAPSGSLALTVRMNRYGATTVGLGILPREPARATQSDSP
jgi:hypothetical protein